MSTQEANWNLLSLIMLPITFVALVIIFVLTKDSGDTISHNYVVGIASIVLVSIAAVICLLTAAFASQPRYNW